MISEKNGIKFLGKATILIIDDEPANLSLLTHSLRPIYQVRASNSGENALHAATSEPRPDLILLDVMMPGMDGYAVLEHLRNNPATVDQIGSRLLQMIEQTSSVIRLHPHNNAQTLSRLT